MEIIPCSKREGVDSGEKKLSRSWKILNCSGRIPVEQKGSQPMLDDCNPIHGLFGAKAAANQEASTEVTESAGKKLALYCPTKEITVPLEGTKYPAGEMCAECGRFKGEKPDQCNFVINTV